MDVPPLILVADDDPLLRKIVEHKLVSRGYRVSLAEDGNEAFRMIEATYPQLVVLDAMMPGADGFEVLRQMKQSPKLADTPVVMLSARKLEVDIVTALQLGASDYLVKPFIPEELALRIARLLQVPAKTREP